MKHLLPFLILSFFFLTANGQNLVPNPSFEEYSECPETVNQIEFASGWSSFRNSIEYLNSCSNDIVVAVPSNQFGYQFPATGEGYAGVFVYSSSEFFREAVGVELMQPLQVGRKYNVSFKVNLASSATYGGCGIDKIGVKFLMEGYTSNQPVPIDNQAHVYSNTVIIDTVDWVMISGDFVADQNYTHLAIGNFFDDQSIDTVHIQPNPEWFSYYYIDDVYVGVDTLTGIQNTDDTQIRIYPNPATNYLVIENLNTETVEIVITNLTGQIVYRTAIGKRYDSRITIQLPSTLRSGFYHLLIDAKNQRNSYPLIIH